MKKLNLLVVCFVLSATCVFFGCEDENDSGTSNASAFNLADDEKPLNEVTSAEFMAFCESFKVEYETLVTKERFCTTMGLAAKNLGMATCEEAYEECMEETQQRSGWTHHQRHVPQESP